MGLGDGSLSCVGNAGNDAKLALCGCDADFATKLGAVWTDAGYNDNYWLSPKQVNLNPAGKFDAAATCVGAGTAGGANPADACCGMVPYHTSAKDCCNNAKIFNFLLDGCCIDG